FMHLADYDELLVSHKIWTEPQHIEQRLADLTQHMSTVIQKYLRNEFETIEDYNEHAGEVAEPFRVLVVANFPFNFTEAAMRYLLSIASSGARCGVYVLASIDTKLALPGGFRLADLEQHAIKLVWKETQFVWKEEAVEKFPLVMDSPPPSDRFSRIVHLTGEAAKDSNRVEVPFEFIAPADDAWWTSDSGSGIEVPLGRAGATKRQSMKLGRGTAQHVLIAGKTGSGKSTLLHALITNSALMYSPDQVEMYLIDFKKGVEFKTYAQYQLPHARVIAIESEREFGLSVLQRLDAELKIRGDMFRDLNVQDLNSFRQADPHTRMPRILLIVDEFQEFFVEDDKIAQDVSLLLDRLVRQGRAFGIHVHLGSQTLGGAYGLARTTLGQMAVRVALQCSEADANLILSEENPAARLLTRPGEAIYNDANGRPEGNNLFQVVWLTDDKHDDYLRRIRELALERKLPTPPQIIFEGNVPAEIGKNTQLEQLISAPAWPASALTTPAWLGEAIAIKDPTAAVFRRQSGANMLMLGQQAEAARALMVSTMFSLAAQHPPAGGDTPGGARFYVLDGSPPDAPQAGALGRIASMLPHPVEVVGARQVGTMMAELAAESERRQTSGETDAPAIFVLIYDLPRFRELRKAEDDFSFSREEKANPAKQLVALLREGPPLGIHVLTWCDTLNNFYRVFERQTLREFETRVLFQMSVADSSSLIDSPAASKLGVFRAFLHSEEQGLLEKFRPYCLPGDEWLARAAELLRRRSVVPATTNPG
ncbi:MAG TPA: FtsK/SpoIIIE domain-containing protein, partial [Pirellulales bacterium]|nr:FtsK/SpoIIIE domain-containing protein [Pirellulales bacterium]